MQETVQVIGHTRTVNGKLVWIPQHQTTVQHSLDDDFEAIQDHPKVKEALVNHPAAEVVLPGPKIPADLDADFEKMLPKIQTKSPETFQATQEPKPEPPAKTVNLQWTPKESPSYLDILHNNEPGHDKVYKVAIVQDPTGAFRVLAQWGKTGKALAQADKGSFPTYAKALGSAEKLLNEKKGKGYHEAHGHEWHVTENYPWQPVTITVPTKPTAAAPAAPSKVTIQPTQAPPPVQAVATAPSGLPGPGITAWKTGTPSGTSIKYGDGLWVMTKHIGVDEELRIGGAEAHSHKVNATMLAIGATWMPVAKQWKVPLNGKPWASGKAQTDKVHQALTMNGFYPQGAGGPSPITVPMASTQIPVGTTKMENGKVYVLNRNHKWELQEKNEHPDDWKKIGPQKGSNPGGLFQESTGKKWYVKTPKSAAQAQNEVLASKLYLEAGLEVPNLLLIQKDGKTSIASEWKEGLTQPSPAAAGKMPGTMDGFVVDAWLCNRDSVGEDFTNLVQGPDGKAYRVDVGGSLLYRAQGGDKPGFGNDVAELASMLDPAINAQTSAVYKGITQKDLEAGAARVLAISDEKIKEMVDTYGPGTSSDKAALVAKLIARKAFIRKAFPGVEKKINVGWATLAPGEEVVEHGEEYGVKWVKIKVPAGGFKATSIPNPPAISASQSAHFNASNTAAAKLIYDTAMAKGTAAKIHDLQVPEVDKTTGAQTGKMIKLTEHPSQHIKNYLTAVSAEVKAQHEPTFKTEYNGSFTGSYNAIAAKLSSSFSVMPHTLFGSHKQKAADYLILSKNAAESVPVPKMGFTEKNESDLLDFKNKCSKVFSTLTGAERTACKSYTGSAYHHWNEQMRAGIIPNEAKPMIAAMAKAAQEIPEGTILWRGIHVGADTYKSVVGAIIQDGSFQSTSYGEGPPFGGTKLRLHIGKGVKGIMAAGVFSKFGTGEREVILPPNCRYAVLKVNQAPGQSAIVDILVLPNNAVVAKESAG